MIEVTIAMKADINKLPIIRHNTHLGKHYRGYFMFKNI